MSKIYYLRKAYQYLIYVKKVVDFVSVGLETIIDYLDNEVSFNYGAQ